MKRIALALITVLALEAPLGALAQHGGRPGGGGGGGARPGGGGARPAAAAPAPRPAAAAPAARPAGGGFNFNQDTRPAARPPAAGGNNGRPPAGGANPRPPTGGTNPRPPAGGTNPRPPGGGTNPRPPGGGNNGGRPPGGRPYPGGRPPNGGGTVVIRPPHYAPGPSWGWNHGVVWAPAPNYWGGGFWGSLAIASASAAIFGSIIAANNQTYTSYQVQPSSPGAQMLQNYQLQQVPCGPPGLVVIFGPDNSVICAQPNDIVAPGNYDLDPATLTLSSQ